MNKYTTINYSYHEVEEPTEVSIKRPVEANDPWAIFNMLHVAFLSMGNNEGDWINMLMTYLHDSGILNVNEEPIEEPLVEEPKLTILN